MSIEQQRELLKRKKGIAAELRGEGKPQEQVARVMGVGQDTISDWEKGTNMAAAAPDDVTEPAAPNANNSKSSGAISGVEPATDGPDDAAEPMAPNANDSKCSGANTATNPMAPVDPDRRFNLIEERLHDYELLIVTDPLQN